MRKVLSVIELQALDTHRNHFVHIFILCISLIPISQFQLRLQTESAWNKSKSKDQEKNSHNVSL